MQRDGVEAVEALHAEGGDELHFRFIGSAQSRFFIVNVQFARRSEGADELLRPGECEALIREILHLVSEQIKNAPNPVCH